MRNDYMLDVLFPRTRQNILATLLLPPERRWYLSDLAQHLKVSPSSLQRELASLAEAGILCREADGNRVYYQLMLRSQFDVCLRPEFSSGKMRQWTSRSLISTPII